MGNSSSNNSPSLTPEQRHKLAWAMPAFCIENYKVTSKTMRIVRQSWEYLMSGQTPPYLAAKAASAEPTLIPVVFFYDKFYSTLFELVPEAKSLFQHGLEGQGRMLAALIKFFIAPDSPSHDAAASDRILVSSLQHLARIHNKIGIKAEAYSIMGIALLASMRNCLGEAYWSDEIKAAWVNIFSRIMAIMMPVIVANEMPRSVRMVGVCPATGMSGDNPHLTASAVGASSSALTSSSSAAVTPIAAQPASAALSPITLSGSASASAGTASDEPVFDYRTAAENMLRAEASHALALKSASSSTSSVSRRVSDLPLQHSVAPTNPNAGPSFIQIYPDHDTIAVQRQKSEPMAGLTLEDHKISDIN